MSGQLGISVEEAAQRLGIGKTLAYGMAERGDLPTVRVGRRVIVPVAELERMMGRTAAGAAGASRREH